MRWLKVFIVSVCFIACHVYGQPVVRSPELLTQPVSEIMVTLREPVSTILRDLAQRSYPSRTARLTAITTTLKAATALSQAPVIAALRSLKVDFTPFWITNKIFIKNGNPAVVRLLEKMDQIKEIRVPKLPSFPPLNPIEGVPPNGTEWNVEIIKAPQVWEMGTDGAGIIVLGIDTGVRASHNAIKEGWVGKEGKGWFDPWYRQTSPTDINGHGTHTIATVCGRTGTGVAPGAKWMACRACDTQGCPEPHLIACGQFAVCPTDPDGRNSDCSHAPHIVTNSWGGGQGEDFYDDAIAAFKTAGIVTIFAIGNDGPKCATAASPGDRDGVLAVGATDRTDKIAKFSSRGPRKSAGDQEEGVYKPQISAPGQKVKSAFMVSDNAYRELSGTSMACPAVAGAAALLMSRNQNLTTEDAIRIFTATADTDLPSAGISCGENTDGTFPNEVYGYGRINVARAYDFMMMEMGQPNEPTIRSTKVKK